MQTIPLQAIPSQNLTYLDPNGNQWDIVIALVAEQIAFTFTLNNTVIMENVTCVAGKRIIPYDYLENGNFVLITQSDEIPDYTQFGITQTLVFLAPSDIATYRRPLSSLTIVTAADFDPNGELPLRFAPKGYILA